MGLRPVERAPEEFDLVGVHGRVLPGRHGEVPSVLRKVEAQRPVKVRRNLGRRVCIGEEALEHLAAGAEGGRGVGEAREHRHLRHAGFLAEDAGRVVDDVGHDVPSHPPLTGRRARPPLGRCGVDQGCECVARVRYVSTSSVMDVTSSRQGLRPAAKYPTERAR